MISVAKCSRAEETIGELRFEIYRATSAYISAARASKAPGDYQKQNDKNDAPNNADTATSEAVAVSTEAIAEASEEKNDWND